MVLGLHRDRTILVVERNISDAMDVQDRIVRDGSRVLTAYSLDRALLLARDTPLNKAIIDFSFDGADEIGRDLTERKIPFVLHAGLSPDHVPKSEDRALRSSTTNVAQPSCASAVWARSVAGLEEVALSATPVHMQSKHSSW